MLSPQLVGDAEIAIRLGAFFVVFALLAVWETLAPRRVLSLPRALR